MTEDLPYTSAEVALHMMKDALSTGDGVSIKMTHDEALILCEKVLGDDLPDYLREAITGDSDDGDH